MVVEGHYNLHDLLDYEDGVTPDEFFELYRECAIVGAKHRQHQVENFVVALGSLFDNKVIRQFNATIDKIVNGLTPAPEKWDREAAMKKNVQELNKLRAIMGVG